MEIFRNDKLIGNNDYYFNQKNKLLMVKNIINFKLDFMGATVFSLSGEGEETYLNGKLISYVSKTKQNNKQKFVNLKFNKETKKFDIKGSSYNGEASSEYIVGNWWNHNILKAEAQISAVSGRIIQQNVVFIGKEEILIGNKEYNSLHFNFMSTDPKLSNDKKLNIDIWYDENSLVWLKSSFNKKGRWEYRLKSIK